MMCFYKGKRKMTMMCFYKGKRKTHLDVVPAGYNFNIESPSINQST